MPQNQGSPSLEQLISGLEGQATAAYTNQYNQAQSQLGGLNQYYNTQADLLGQQTGYGEELLNNQYGGNQLQQQNISQEMATAQQQQGYEVAQYGISQQQLGLEGTENTQQYGNTMAGLGLQQKLLGTQEQVASGTYGLQQGSGGVGGGGYAAQLANLSYQLPQQIQSQQGASAASGAGQTVGARNALSSINEQYQYNTGNVRNQQAQSALAYQGQQAGFGYQQGQIGLQGTEAQQQEANQAQNLALQGQSAALGQQSEVSGYQGQQQGYQNTQQQLQNAAAALGISEQQLQSQLQAAWPDSATRRDNSSRTCSARRPPPRPGRPRAKVPCSPKWERLRDSDRTGRWPPSRTSTASRRIAS